MPIYDFGGSKDMGNPHPAINVSILRTTKELVRHRRKDNKKISLASSYASKEGFHRAVFVMDRLALLYRQP